MSGPGKRQETAEEFLRDKAVILAVGKQSSFSGISLDPLDPYKTYVLAIVEAD